MIAISGKELENADYIGQYKECPICGKDALVNDTRESNPEATNILYYIRCCDTTYLVGLNGKVINFKK